jgi:hypothetical protein
MRLNHAKAIGHRDAPVGLPIKARPLRPATSPAKHEFGLAFHSPLSSLLPAFPFTAS